MTNEPKRRRAPGGGAKPGNKNRMNADQPASAIIQIRVQPDLKAELVACANKEGLTLSEWALGHLTNIIRNKS